MLKFFNFCKICYTGISGFVLNVTKVFEMLARVTRVVMMTLEPTNRKVIQENVTVVCGKQECMVHHRTLIII